MGGGAVSAGAAELAALDERANVRFVISHTGLWGVAELYEFWSSGFVAPEFERVGGDSEERRGLGVVE